MEKRGWAWDSKTVREGEKSNQAGGWKVRNIFKGGRDGRRGRKAGRKEKKGILTYFWSLQTVLFGVVQKGGHVIIQLGLQTVDQVSESR